MPAELSKFLPVAIAGSIVALTTTVILVRRWKKANQSANRKWMKVGVVSELHVYPVKSLQGIEVKSAEATDMGLVDPITHLGDRCFMLIDGETNRINLKLIPKLALPKMQYTESSITVSAEGMDDLVLDISELRKRVDCEGRNTACKIKEKCTNGVDCGDDSANWWKKYLEREDNVRMVAYPDSAFAYDKNFDTKCESLFSDFAPYLLTTSGSIDDLNKRLAKLGSEPVPMANFRSNIVVDTSAVASAWAEDDWSAIQIGKCIFDNKKPCGRCLMTTVDLEIGEKRSDGQPMKELQNFRVEKDLQPTPNFGAHLAFAESSPNDVIQVGDSVYAVIKDDWYRKMKSCTK